MYYFHGQNFENLSLIFFYDGCNGRIFDPVNVQRQQSWRVFYGKLLFGECHVIWYDAAPLTCIEKVTGSQVNFPHGGISQQATGGDRTQVCYFSITKSRLTRPIIITWCCYNIFCVLYVRSQASSSSFNWRVPQPGHTQRLGSQLSFL